MALEIIKKMIPSQLQNEAFGFVKIPRASKKPFEPQWQKKPYSYSEIVDWIAQGGNYGVFGGHGDLIIIDADKQEISELVSSVLPATFTVKTPRTGHHFYFLCKDIKKKIVLKKGEEHFGEIISYGFQAVGPGSIHPDTGTEYEVLSDVEIATVSREQVFSVLMEYISLDFPQGDADIEADNIQIIDILSKAGISTKKIGCQLVCGHPVHGSTNSNNFVVNLEKNVWHCFRCGSGGGPMSLIAVLERIIDCTEAKPGGLRGDKFLETCKVAQEKYGFTPRPKVFEKCEKIISEGQLSEFEARIKAIPHDTEPVKLPQLLDPLLREMAKFNIAQGDAILRHTIKVHFSLTNDELKSYEKVLKSYRKEPKEKDARKSLSKSELIEILHDEQDNKIIHPAQDYSEGIMTYAFKVNDIPCLITSDKRLFTMEDASSEGFNIRHTTVDTARFSASGVTSYLDDKYEIRIPLLYQKIHDYVGRFIHFPDELYLDYVSLWVMGTYVFMIFRYYPYVWLNAEKGSGKSLLMEILSTIAFNGELITSPTESVIFRDISNNLITMFIDEVEQLRKRDKDTYGSLISLLNAGFNKAGVVKRTESTGQGSFVVRAYSAYSPKMFAGINEIDDVLQDRTVRIPLLRKKDTETVQRYKETPEIIDLQRSIRDDLYVFGLIYAKEIAEYYHREGPDGIEGMSHLNNRELDIWEPIFLLANVVDAQSEKFNLTVMMEALSKKSLEEKQSDSVSQNETYKILSVLKAMPDEVTPLSSDGNVQIYEAGRVLEYFRKTEDFDWIEKTQALTRKLKKVKVASDQKRIDGDKRRVYIINVGDLADLFERFKI